jgi:hypothetical protein
MSLSATDLFDMRTMGVKLIRLGVMWEAVEVQPGVYNTTYLDEVEKLINTIG